MSINPKQDSTPSRRRWLGLGLALLPVGLLYALRLNEVPIGAFTDDAYYIEMARSIAEGLGPVLDLGPDAPAAHPQIFPSGFPYLLSPLARFFPASLGVFRIVPLLSLLLLLPICLGFPGRGGDNRLRMIMTAGVILNPWVIAWSTRVLSDIPYTTLSLAALLLFLRLQRRRPISRRGAVALVVLCAAGVGVRTIGWSAVLAMSAILVSQRRWPAAVALPAAVAVLLAPVWLATGRNAGIFSRAYEAQMFAHQGLDLWRFAWGNLVGYVTEVAVIGMPLFGDPAAGVMENLRLGWLYPAVASLTGAVLLLMAGLAVKVRWRDPDESPAVRLFAFYLVIYAAVLAQFDGYPSGVQTRLLIPVLPVLFWLGIAGLRDFSGAFSRPLPSLVLGLMLVSALAHNGWRITHPLRTTTTVDGRGLVDPGQGADWILANTEPGAVIMVQEPLVRHIHFRRPVIAFPTLDAPAIVATKVEIHRVAYIFVGPSVHHLPNGLDARGQAMLQLLQSRPDLYRMVHADAAGGIHIFACGS